jgi:hypothetical protein
VTGVGVAAFLDWLLRKPLTFMAALCAIFAVVFGHYGHWLDALQCAAAATICIGVRAGLHRLSHPRPCKVHGSDPCKVHGLDRD